MIKKLLIRLFQAKTKIQKIGMGRYLDKVFTLLKLNLSTKMFILKYLQIILNLRIHVKSKKFYIFSMQDTKKFISKDTRIFEFKKEQLIGMENLITHCNNVFNKKKKFILENYQPPVSVVIGKINEKIITNQEVDELTPIIKFASQPFLMHLTSNYIKKIPMIISATLTFAKPTKNNYNPINFQNFHSDLLDESVLHLVIPIRNIYSENGPFTFIHPTASKRITEATNYQGGRISDDIVYKYVKKQDIKELTGEAGKAWIMSPFHCLHMGARIKKGMRLMLVISYASPNMCIEHACNLGKRSTRDKLLAATSSKSERALLRVYH